MNDDAESDVANVDGTPRGGLGRTVSLQNNTSMGEQSADIVVGALRKVRLRRLKYRHHNGGELSLILALTLALTVIPLLTPLGPGQNEGGMIQ